jgi:hypothetical protein
MTMMTMSSSGAWGEALRRRRSLSSLGIHNRSRPRNITAVGVRKKSTDVNHHALGATDREICVPVSHSLLSPSPLVSPIFPVIMINQFGCSAARLNRPSQTPAGGVASARR